MIDAVTVGATSTLVLVESPKKNRNMVVFCNNSNEDIYLSPGPVAQSTYGIPLIANGGSFVDKPDTRGKMYQGSYHAICASGGKVLSVAELND